MELQTGASAATMSLELFSKDDVLIAKLDNDSALLGSYHADNDMRLHVSKFQLLFLTFFARAKYLELVKIINVSFYSK